MNCLRCRHCQMLPQTQVKPLTVILCAKRNIITTPTVHFDCGIADPNPRYRGSSSQSVKLNGDRTRNASEFEKAFLRAHYQTGDLRKLSKLTGRTVETIKAMAFRYDWPHRSPFTRKSIIACRAKRQNKGKIFNEAQSKVAHEYYLSGRWAYRGGQWSEEKLKEREALKCEIVEAVSALGPPRTWTQIVRHIQYRSPAYQRQQMKRRARRKAARELAA